jgi:hypothetical protein
MPQEAERAKVGPKLQEPLHNLSNCHRPPKPSRAKVTHLTLEDGYSRHTSYRAVNNVHTVPLPIGGELSDLKVCMDAYEIMKLGSAYGSSPFLPAS